MSLGQNTRLLMRFEASGPLRWSGEGCKLNMEGLRLFAVQQRIETNLQMMLNFYKLKHLLMHFKSFFYFEKLW